MIPPRVVGVSEELPTHEILRLHDGQSRTQMHRGAAHVVGVSYSYHSEVRNICPDDWVVRKFIPCLILRRKLGQKHGRQSQGETVPDNSNHTQLMRLCGALQFRVK